METTSPVQEIEIANGQNIIDIYYDDFASCLIIKRALAVNWPDCAGSVGEYYAISSFSTDERNFYTYTINEALSEGNDDEQIEAVKDFLNLFADGKYTIVKYRLDISLCCFLQSEGAAHAKPTSKNLEQTDSFYPSYSNDSEAQIFSITNDKINYDRVEHYCEQIKNGGMPTVLVFEISNLLSSDYSRSYVLDGHHKILAYQKLKQNIPVIRIMKHEACTGKTSSLLHAVKPVLTGFEYHHLFVNNDDNMLAIDFINDEELTADLDHILKHSDRVDVSIVNILRKYAAAKDQAAASWLQNRLDALKKNRYINLLGYGNGLAVYEQRENRFGWFSKKIASNGQLKTWINETILPSE